MSIELHAAAAAAIIRPVALDALVLDPAYQLRERLEQWKVEEYAAAFDRLPPVLAARIGSDLVLLGGFHRVAAARLLGRELIDARIETVDADQAFVLTVRANAAHGLPLKTKEKKAAARGLLRRFPQRSDRWIAEDAGLSNVTVGALRAEMEAGDQIEHLSHTEDRDGKHYASSCAAALPPAPAREEGPARTVGAVARRLGLSATLIDVDPAYCRIAQERCARGG